MTFILVGIVFLAYYLPKSIGYPKVGKFLSVILILIFSFFLLKEMFRDELFTKDEALELLGRTDVKLNDSFSIVENKSKSDMGDYYHIFSVSISENDKKRIIHEITSSKNFNLSSLENYIENREDYFNGPKRIKNYENENEYVRELFEPKGNNHAPIRYFVKVNKSSNVLIFEDIID